MMSIEQRSLRATGWGVALLLIVVVMVFVIIRVSIDVGNLSAGRVPAEGEFDRRYAENPLLAYLHIVPGVVYLIGAPLQLSARRRRNLAVHRRIGKVVLSAGLLTGVMALAVGVAMPYGGMAETTASIVFGVWFLACLALAYRAIRTGRVGDHRRWMIRAFAVGVGVGLIRILIGIGEAVGIGIADSFGAAFWLAFSLMAVAAEVWLRFRPAPY